MTISELQSKILNSHAFESLNSEQLIMSSLKSLEWKVLHSCFYPDMTTAKLREIDVLGKQVWARELKRGRELAYLNLVVESKSAKGYHLLFSPSEDPDSGWGGNSEWLGFEENRERITKTLDETILKEEQVAFILKKLENMAYPGGLMFLRSLHIESPPSKIYSSAFRETNIGSVKDLDSSVLWRAGQSLFSAIRSLKEQYLIFCLEDLPLEVEMAQKYKEDLVGKVLEYLTERLALIDIYHPVVVIDANLWITDKGNLQDIEWCRFEQLGINHSLEWWFDVVHASYFDEYARKITREYQKKFRKVRAHQVKKI